MVSELISNDDISDSVVPHVLVLNRILVVIQEYLNALNAKEEVITAIWVESKLLANDAKLFRVEEGI